MDSLLFLGFFSGFVGGFAHCSFMCTPIISSFKDHSSNFQSLQFFYHFGRMFTYGLLGMIAGYTGSFVNTVGSIFGIQNIIRISVSLFLIFKGLEILNLFYFKKLFYFFDWLEKKGFHFSKVLIHFKDLHSIWKYFLYGIILGLLPCGLSYTALITASSTLHPFKGFLFMFLFGLGNIPALWLMVNFYNFFIKKINKLLYKILGVIFILFGIYFLYESFSKFF